MDHDQYNTVCWSCVMISCFVLFCFVLLSYVCGYGVDHMVSFGGLLHFSCSVVDFIFVFSPASSGDVKGLLDTFHRCDHKDRVQVKGHGGVSSTFKTLRPSQDSGLRSVSWWVSLVHTSLSTQQAS